MQANGKPLHNIGVLVTRPAHQAGHFIQLLQQAGATAIEFPAIEIDQPDNTETVQARIAQLDDYDLVIFISSNAVEYGLKFMQQAGKRLLNPVAAIGRSTASCLQRHNIAVSVQPENGFNSEALLASKALQAAQVKGKKVLIVRGQGGLELLANSLQQRGARVDYAEVYQRRQPLADCAPLNDMWRKQRIQIVTVTSNEALKNLYHMLDKTGQDYLLSSPLLVPGQRCAELARRIGFKDQILTAANATDQAMLDRLQQWHNS